MKTILTIMVSFVALISSSVYAGGHGATKVALVPGGPHPYFAAL